jgi:S1-C subfamily serine protease
LDAERYEDALQLLEKKGAGNSLSKNASGEAITARNLYCTFVSERYTQLAEDALTEGKARQADGVIYKGLELCPWSAMLKEARKEHSQRIALLNQLLAELYLLTSEEVERIQHARLVLEKLVPVQHLMNDTPPLIQCGQHFRHVLIQHTVEQIRHSCRQFSQPEIDVILRDLSLTSSDEDTVTTFKKLLLLLPRLPSTGDSSQVNLTCQQESDIESLAEIVNSKSSSAWSQNLLAPCYQAIRNSFCEFLKEDFPAFVANQGVSFSTITLAEQLLVQLPVLNEPHYLSALAHGHVWRARYRASQGKLAGLALVHLRRAQTLNASSVKSDKTDLEQLCQASLRTALPIRVSISIDSEPSIDPEASQLLQYAIALQLMSTTQNHWEWEWSHPVKESIVKLYISRSELISTSPEDLSTISSQYLSHYEDVPNPVKSQLKSGLTFQETLVHQAESQYRSAVNAHNVYPTTYSLQVANNAYTRYTMALNTYNGLVTQYNVTPSTVSRPVYLPYSFIAGTVRSGWIADVAVHVGKHSKVITAESVESDFVRIGTNLTDKSPAYRRDDPLSIDVGAPRLIEQLAEVSTSVCDSLSESLVDIPIETRAELTDDERTLLNCVLHPFNTVPKTLPRMTRISWAVKLADEVVLPDRDISPIERQLAKPPNVSLIDRSPRDVAVLYEPLVCEMRSSFARASGVLISGDGLILTCAHVLLGADHKAVFHSGHLRGEFKLEFVFVNEAQDVAIVRAVGVVSESWALLRLQNQCVKGEKIAAIGNPSLVDKSVSYGGVSDGIVSNEFVKMKDGHERLVGDITVSQGSSGGPLVSMETGEVVGIVTHIVEAGIHPDPTVSTSGYSCLAAPAFKLTDWLGISY